MFIMTARSGTAITLILLLLSACSSNSGKQSGEWVSLFNGKDLRGWEAMKALEDEGLDFWSVEDGCIVANSIGSTEHNYHWLMSEEEYGDFELRFKFQASRLTKGNSGLQFRSRYYQDDVVDDGVHGWLDGPQMDIEPKHSFRCGYIYDETRDTKRWINPSLSDWNISPEDVPVSNAPFYYEDEGPGWNEFTLVAKGMFIKTVVNGVTVSDFDASGILDDEAHRRYNVGTKGHILLQIHKFNEVLVRFKDIEIRELPESKN